MEEVLNDERKDLERIFSGRKTGLRRDNSI